MNDPPSDGEIESTVAFALEHSTTGVDRDTLAHLLRPLPTRHILDGSGAGERALLASLLAADMGASAPWQLLILGCRTPVDRDAFSGLLDEAERRVKQGAGREGSVLELVVPPVLGEMRESLKERGYAHAFAYLSLVAEVRSPVEAVETAWHDVDASNVDNAYACYRDAFMETGAPVVSPEEARAILPVSNPRARLLFSNGEVGAVLRVAWRDEAARSGELRFVCRSPRFRGQGLGDRAMCEAFRVLRRMGASIVQLDVASTNRKALDLYNRWGFQRQAQEDVFRIALCPVRHADARSDRVG